MLGLEREWLVDTGLDPDVSLLLTRGQLTD